jgi:hypothetical protein
MRTQKTNVVYAISDGPMSADEWKKRYVTPPQPDCGTR